MLTTTEAHKSITVSVTADDGNGGSVTADSASMSVSNAAPVNSVAPVISGTLAVCPRAVAVVVLGLVYLWWQSEEDPLDQFQAPAIFGQADVEKHGLFVLAESGREPLDVRVALQRPHVSARECVEI